MQVKVTKPSDITYEVHNGGVAVDLPNDASERWQLEAGGIGSPAW